MTEFREPTAAESAFRQVALWRAAAGDSSALHVLSPPVNLAEESRCTTWPNWYDVFPDGNLNYGGVASSNVIGRWCPDVSVTLSATAEVYRTSTNNLLNGNTWSGTVQGQFTPNNWEDYFFAFANTSTPAAPATAQQEPQQHPAAAELVLMRSLPPGAAAVVQRGIGGQSRNLILVTESTTVADLKAALAVLRSLRERNGEESPNPQRVIIPPVGVTPTIADDDRRNLNSHLDHVRIAQVRQVENLGRVRSITIPLAPLDTGGGRAQQ